MRLPKGSLRSHAQTDSAYTAPMLLHPFFDGLRPTLLIAHRGGAAIAPENTSLAFSMAVDAFHADMLEIDVHLSRDGVLVVSHDPTLERCTDGEGTIAEHLWAELQRLDAGYRFTRDGGVTFPFRGTGLRLPRLDQVLADHPNVRFNIELKANQPGAAEALADVIRQASATYRVCLGSEHDDLAARLVSAIPDACFFYPRALLTNLVMALRTNAPWSWQEPYLVLDVPLEHAGTRIVDHALLRAAEAAGRWVNVWTVDDTAQMRDLADLGVGGIMTDRPDLLRETLDAPRQQRRSDVEVPSSAFGR